MFIIMHLWLTQY